MRPKFRLHASFARVSLAVSCCGLLAVATQAQTNFQRIKSFGFPELSGYRPNSIIEARDGKLYGTTAEFGTVFTLNNDGAGYKQVYTFSGFTGAATLIEGSDGMLYGTTAEGGTNAAGTVFKLNKDGSGFQVLRGFPDNAAEGRSPNGIVEASDGALYGTARAPRDNSGRGTVFKLNKDGSGYTVLYRFAYGYPGRDGEYPEAGLVAGSDGALYGTTAYGGAYEGGTVFKLNKNGSGYAVLHTFTNRQTFQLGPNGPNGLLEGRDGSLYGTTAYFGTNDVGTVFKLNKDGSGYTVLLSFTVGEDFGGITGPSGLIEASNGVLFGTTAYGGTTNANSGLGTVFRINKDGIGYAVLQSFHGHDGSHPSALSIGSSGSLYVTTEEGGGASNGGTVSKLNLDGGSNMVLHSFHSSGNGGDGAFPTGMIDGEDEKLYGTTSSGGSNEGGTVFKVNNDGSGYAMLRSFMENDADGGSPVAGVVEASDGALYGTTVSGAGHHGWGPGTVFKLNKDGSDYTVLRRFTGMDGDGVQPTGLIEGSDGALYGITYYGGTNGAGTVFRLNKEGTGYLKLHVFSGSGGGGNGGPAVLLEGSDGALYGTTEYGGTGICSGGTVFKLNENGSGYAVLRSFDGCGDAFYHPPLSLMQGSDGALYGTTSTGGQPGGSNSFGAIFKLNKDGGSYTVLHLFTDINDGYDPATLIQGSNGLLYGTAWTGGSNGSGTVFKVNKDGSGFMVLRSFSADGRGGTRPSTGLLQASDGALYGTTSEGGDMGLGTVFKLFSSTPVVTITGIELSGGGARLSFSGGAAGQTFQIQATANLDPPLWQPIGTNQFGIDGKFQFLDTGASNYPARFYRSATP